jgi:hypothetical protein
MEILELEVDVSMHEEYYLQDSTGKRLRTQVGFLGFQGGIRSRWIHGYMHGKPGYFIVFPDFIHEAGATMFTKQHSSPKMWHDPVTVVDCKQISEEGKFKHAWYDKVYEKSMYAQLPLDRSIQFVMHVLLAWILGCGKDWAMSNFFILPNGVYQVDLDMFCDFFEEKTDLYDLTLFRTPASRVNYERFMKEHGETIREQLIHVVRPNLDKIMGLRVPPPLKRSDVNEIYRRLNSVLLSY